MMKTLKRMTYDFFRTEKTWLLSLILISHRRRWLGQGLELVVHCLVIAYLIFRDFSTGKCIKFDGHFPCGWSSKSKLISYYIRNILVNNKWVVSSMIQATGFLYYCIFLAWLWTPTNQLPLQIIQNNPS